jgi:uncharacterized protein YdcH (DUF465 family)
VFRSLKAETDSLHEDVRQVRAQSFMAEQSAAWELQRERDVLKDTMQTAQLLQSSVCR